MKKLHLFLHPNKEVVNVIDGINDNDNTISLDDVPDTLLDDIQEEEFEKDDAYEKHITGYKPTIEFTIIVETKGFKNYENS